MHVRDCECLQRHSCTESVQDRTLSDPEVCINNVPHTEINAHIASVGARQCVSSAGASRKCLLVCGTPVSTVAIHGVTTTKDISNRILVQ
jgi:hypothetical protein